VGIFLRRSLAGGNGIADSDDVVSKHMGNDGTDLIDDKEPIASFGEFVYDYGDLGIYNTVFCGGFSKHKQALIFEKPRRAISNSPSIV
jgi:hypothetical protein